MMAGLLPIMWGSGTGSEVMSRIAAPMVGGMISSTVLTLGVIPARPSKLLQPHEDFNMNRRRFFLQTGALAEPGMDLPGRTDPYGVQLVGADGQSTVFATYPKPDKG